MIRLTPSEVVNKVRNNLVFIEMKKAFVLFASFVLLLSCSKEFIESPVLDQEDGPTSLSVLGAMHYDADTRTIYTDDGEGGALTSWKNRTGITCGKADKN